MNVNEIKKLLYKEKPVAVLVKVKDDIYYYTAQIKEPRMTVDFEVPLKDMWIRQTDDVEDAQLLIRWLKTDLEK